MIRIEKYENYSASEYYDAVTTAPEMASEGVYYLLRRRLARALGRVYDLHGFGLDDHFDDTIDDFYLYLYERDLNRPFALFDAVREKQAFFGWMVSTYRNFLINKGKEEMKRREMMEIVRRSSDDDDRHCSDESLMRFITTAIAYADQELPPRNRFIFYRMLLTILNQRMALPQEQMARALRMHPVTYRVCATRLKTRLSKCVANLEEGRRLPLDSSHQLMQCRLFNGFDHLYETLMPYYESALRALSGHAEIDALREGYSPDGMTMHEGLEYSYPHVVEVRRLYQALKSYATSSKNSP